MTKSVNKKIDDFFGNFPTVSFKKSEIIITPEDEISYIYLLKKGKVRMYSDSKEGLETTFHIFYPLSFFPIMLVLSRKKNVYYFSALENVSAIKAPTREVIQFLKREKDVLFDLTSRFSEAILGLSERIENLTEENAFKKTLSLLIYLSNKLRKENVGNKNVITASHAELSYWVGVRRETISRQLKKMEKYGLIKINKNAIVIRKSPGKFKKYL